MARSRCRICKAHKSEQPISARGLCTKHRTERMMENAMQLRAHRGPWFEHWRRRSLLALGVHLPESDDGG